MEGSRRQHKPIGSTKLVPEYKGTKVCYLESKKKMEVTVKALEDYKNTFLRTLIKPLLSFQEVVKKNYSSLQKQSKKTDKNTLQIFMTFCTIYER